VGKYDSFKLTLDELRVAESRKVMRQRQRGASENPAFQKAFHERLRHKEKLVFELAMRQDKTQLARLFAYRWALNKISERDEEYFATLSAALAEMLFRVLDAKTHGATAKLANDPKQAVKSDVFKLWLDWQAGKTLHKSGAAFHRFVLDQYPIIVDTKTVARWCKVWAVEIRK